MAKVPEDVPSLPSSSETVPEPASTMASVIRVASAPPSTVAPAASPAPDEPDDEDDDDDRAPASAPAPPHALRPSPATSARAANDMDFFTRSPPRRRSLRRCATRR